MSALVLSALVAGLVGSVHCAAMCSAFAAASAVRPEPGSLAIVHPLAVLRRRIAWVHAGRLGSYAALGAVVGALGQPALATDGLAAQRVVGTVANLMLLALAVSIGTGRPLATVLERAGLVIHRGLVPRVRSRVARPTLAGRIAFGMLWGLTPCGLVYAVLPVAMFAGSAVDAAGVMLAFGLGTLPSLLVIGAMSGRLSRGIAGPRARYLGATFIGALAFAGLHRALVSAQPLAGGAFCLTG